MKQQKVCLYLKNQEMGEKFGLFKGENAMGVLGENKFKKSRKKYFSVN